MTVIRQQIVDSFVAESQRQSTSHASMCVVARRRRRCTVLSIAVAFAGRPLTLPSYQQKETMFSVSKERNVDLINKE